MSPKHINTVIGLPEELPEDGSIDAGLLLLELVTPAGSTRSLGEIAIACGIRKQKVYYIEQCALRKIRTEFAKRGLGPRLLEVFDEPGKDLKIS